MDTGSPRSGERGYEKIMIQIAMTAQQFLEQRSEMPEAGQWAELHAGVPVFLELPDVDHGTAVLNLSKALAGYFQQSPIGYACFDIGLQLAHQPDTVLFPAVCLYLGGPMFAESDREITESVPAVIVELASTRDRRAHLDGRILRWLQWGVREVWSIDPKALSVQIDTHSQNRELHGADGRLTSGNLRGFELTVSELFRVPDWAK